MTRVLAGENLAASNTLLKRMKGRQKLLINVSTFITSNASHKRKMTGITRILKQERARDNRIWRVHKISRRMSQRGLDYLNRRFSPFRIKSEFIHHMFGMFQGQSEPSLGVELKVRVRDLPAIAKQVVAFGKNFDQESVHITHSFGKLLPHDEPVKLPEHASCELCWLVWLKELQDISSTAKLAKKCGIENLSLRGMGNQLLLYTFGNKGNLPPRMPMEFRRLKKALVKEDLILKEKIWHARLINFGNKDYGASHNYEEAGMLLDAQIRKRF